MQALRESVWQADTGQPELKQLVTEASRALALLDAGRLEELALCCATLTRTPWNADQQQRLARQARDAAADMAIFARVLEATRGNVIVIKRLREMRAGRFEYSESQARGWIETESGHGHD
jgi:hypothetical protein